MKDAAASAGEAPDAVVLGATAHPALEERLNALTHGAGCALAVVGTVVLLAKASRDGSPWHVGAAAVYCVTMVAAYAASTLSHVFRSPRIRNGFRIADQALIFLYIAGSWTPIAAAWLRGGRWWWAFHATLWAVAVGGFVSKALFAHRVRLGTVSAALYMLLGWSPMFVALPLAHTLPTPLCYWLIAGGVCYSLGLVFFKYDHRFPYFHAAWHVLVIAGSACHYAGIFWYCTGPA